MSPAPDQRQRLRDAEQQLALGPVAMAGELGVSYNTYKCWKNECRGMTPLGWRCLELVCAARGVKNCHTPTIS